MHVVFRVPDVVNEGCVVVKLADSDNPIYMVRYSAERVPLIGFSKVFNHPFIPGAEMRYVFPISKFNYATKA